MEDTNIHKQNNKKCSKCKEYFVYDKEEVFWDEHGYGYSTCLVYCPYCGNINILKHVEDKSLNINEDKRFYK